MFRKIKRLLGGFSPLSKKELVKLGARIGYNFHNYGIIDEGHCFLLTVGDNVTLATASRILLHDASTKKTLGYSKIGRVEIGSNVFIGSGAIILPNVKIGSNVIIGAGSVVAKDISSDSVVVGNPCRVIGTYTDYMQKNYELFNIAPKFDTFVTKKTKKERQEEFEKMKNGGIGFDL